MKKKLAIILAVLCALAALPVLAQEQVEFAYHVILPEDYEQSGLNYPVAYVLPQEMGPEDTSGLAEALRAALDERGVEMIIVEPALRGEGDLGEEMAAFAAHIDAQYRTVADAAHRVLLGTGRGGALAWSLALQAPETFGLTASIRGDFSGDENVYAQVQKAGEKGMAGLYSYIDAPVDDEWTNAEGGTNDIGALCIGYKLSAADHEFTVRPGAFAEEFMQESARRLADRLTARMTGSLATGALTLENSTVKAEEPSVRVQFSAQLSEQAQVFGEGFAAELVLKVIDPETGAVLSQTPAGSFSGTEEFSGEAEVENIVNGESSNVVLCANLLGGEVQLASASLIRLSDVLIDGDVQKIELAGDWYFRYVGAQESLDAAALTAEEYETWSVVQPGLGNWEKGYGNIDDTTVNTGFGGADFFNYMITGNGYYAKSFFVPEEFDSEEPVLSVGYVDDRCEAYLNGVKIGSTGMTEDGRPNGETTWAEYSAFAIDPALLVRGGENTVVVRAWNDTPYGAGGWYSGPIGLYSEAAMAQSGGGDGLTELTFLSEYAGKALDKGEAVENQYLLYLPEGYEESERRYPTLYLLHQFNSDHTSYRTDEVDRLLDEGAAAGLFDEMIVVIPNSDGNSWWTGDWERMVTEELVPLIDSEYRTIRDARYRLTAGCSMGGQGAYAVALRNPDVFSGAVSFYGAFSYGGESSPNAIAAAESKEFMDYFSMAFICGNQDSYGFGVPAIELHRQLDALGVDHFFLIDNGGHDSGFYVPFFDECLGFVRADMYQADASAAELIRAEVALDGGIIRAEYEADEAILACRNVTPASSFGASAAQPVSLPLVVQAVREGEVVFAAEQADVLLDEGSLSGVVEFDAQGADLSGCTLVLKAQLFDAVEQIAQAE
ncbi:MAG: alpha/beta hydrolase-fold protein [Eubacteriales bacterium]|nr:alpha/beta hydrolase-fold protein [Eubacteriales bacterium]